MIRSIIFDWSGTLVDDLPAVWQASNFVFKNAGVPELTLERFRAEFCLPFKPFYDRYTPHVAMPQLEAWFHEAFRQSDHLVAALPHAREFLECCREQGCRTFVLSAVHPEHFARQIASTGFAPLIEKSYVGVWDKRAKIHEILTRHGLNADETLFVGDMQHDIETAHHGGVRACAVLTGYNGLDQLRASQPDLIVEHLGELQAILVRNGFALGAGATPLEAMPMVTVGAVIFHPRAPKVLLVRTHKWSNLWGIPGGKVRYGERCLDALERELKEETNLKIGKVEFVMVQDCIGSKEFYRDAHFVLLNYACHCVGSAEVKLNEEAREHRWVTMADALALPLNRPTRTLLENLSEHCAAQQERNKRVRPRKRKTTAA